MSLFEPYTLPVSGVTLPNRLILAPMTTYSGTPEGQISPGEVALLQRRAAGGFGTVITAACYVDRAGQAFINQWGCDNDDKLDSLRQAASAIKAEGAIAILQIHDGGRMADPKVLIAPAPRSASAVAAERQGYLEPRAMSAAEVEKSIADFAAAAKRAAVAGFDGVEIHGANTYLIQQFFSPHSNRRDDEWGGDLERRLRYPITLAKAVREAVGDTFIVGYRFSPEEIENPGITIEDTLVLVDRLADCRLDYLHISLGNYAAGSMRNPESTQRLGPLVIEKLAGRVPLMAVGGIETPEQAELPLSDGAELVALGRVALWEPEWPNKVKAGRSDLRQALPAKDGDVICSLPKPLYDVLVQRAGWVKVAAE